MRGVTVPPSPPGHMRVHSMVDVVGGREENGERDRSLSPSAAKVAAVAAAVGAAVAATVANAGAVAVVATVACGRGRTALP